MYTVMIYRQRQVLIVYLRIFELSLQVVGDSLALAVTQLTRIPG